MDSSVISQILPDLRLALAPAATALIGGLLAEVVNISNTTLRMALHLAAGVVFGIVGVELMPEVLQASRPWLVILIYLIGGVGFLVVDWLTGFIQSLLGEEEAGGEKEQKNEGNGTTDGKKQGKEEQKQGDEEKERPKEEQRSDKGKGQDNKGKQQGDKKKQGGGKAPWVVFLGVSVDLLTDGMMIVAGSTLGTLGLPLAIAAAVVELPESFSTIATFKKQNVSRGKRILLSIALAVVILLGVPLGYWMVHGRPQIVTYGVLAFTAGFLSLLMAAEMLPRAHKTGQTRIGAFLFVFGFAVVALVSSYIGQSGARGGQALLP